MRCQELDLGNQPCLNYWHFSQLETIVKQRLGTSVKYRYKIIVKVHKLRANLNWKNLFRLLHQQCE